MTSTTPTPPRRGMRGSAMNMFVSMAVVLGLCFVFIAFVPRMREGAAPRMAAPDVSRRAEADAQDAPWEVSVPENLVRGWNLRNSQYVRSTSDLWTWHMGYDAPTGQYVALEEAQDVTKDWLEERAGKPTGEGTLVIDGQRWVKYADETRNHLALVRVQGSLTTVVSGPPAYEVLAELAASLRPRAKSTAVPTA